MLTGDHGLIVLEAELLEYPNVARIVRRGFAELGDETRILGPFLLAAPNGTVLSFFTTLTTFGTPLDVTLDELAVELFFPADDPTEDALRASQPCS